MTVNSVGQNPFQPGIRQQMFVPDQLIAGNAPLLVTDTILIAMGQMLKRGTVLGRQSVKALKVTAAAGNTGNGTVTAAAGTAAETGAYTLTATAATAFTLKDPNGVQVGTVNAGTPFASNQLTVSVTAGATAYVAGDVITLTVAPAPGTYVECVRTATDGSQTPSAILVDDVDSTLGVIPAGGYLQGKFNLNYVTYDASWTADDIKASLRPLGIFLDVGLSGAPV